MDLASNNNIKVYNKTFESDLYIMIPYSKKDVDVELPIINNDEIQKHYINTMNETSSYECNNDVISDLKRVCIGKNYLACFDDEYDGEIKYREEVNMFLTIHEETGIYLLTLMNLKNKFSPTQIQDQVTTNNLFIYDNNKLVELDTYMAKKYNLNRCGESKILVSLSNKPKDELEFYCMLAGETYISEEVDYIIDSKDILDISKNDFSQYDFYEIYASKNTIVYVLKNFESTDIENIKKEVPILFIMELIMFQSASVLRTSSRIENKLAMDGDISLKYIEKLYVEFGKTIKFWRKDIFKYTLTKNIASYINEAFETDKILDNYHKNQDFLEHIVNLRDVQNSNKENRILNLVVIFLTIVQVLPLIINFINWINTGGNVSFDWQFFGFGIIIIILIIWIIKNRENKNKLRKVK